MRIEREMHSVCLCVVAVLAAGAHPPLARVVAGLSGRLRRSSLCLCVAALVRTRAAFESPVVGQSPARLLLATALRTRATRTSCCSDPQIIVSQEYEYCPVL